MQTEFVPEDRREVETLPLSTRARNALRAARILTVSQIRALTLPQLMEFKNVGHGTAVEVLRVLRQEGIALRDQSPAPAPEPSPVVGLWRNVPLRGVDLPVSVIAALRTRGIYVVGELCRLTPDELPADLRAPVLKALAPHGLLLQGSAAEDPSALPLLESLPLSWADRSLEMLDLTQRSRNALRRVGILTLGQLGRLTPAQLLSIRTFGQTCLQDVRAACYRRGLFSLVADKPVETEPSLDVLDLPDRFYSILRMADIWTLDQLCSRSVAALLQLPGMRSSSVRLVQDALARIGRSLRIPTAGSGPVRQPDPLTLADWTKVILWGLQPRQRELLVLRSGLYSGVPLSRSQVGTQMGIVGKRVCDREGKVMARLARLAPARLERFSREMAALIGSAGGIAPVAEVAGSMTHLYPAGGIDPVAFARVALPLCPDLEHWHGDWWAVKGTDYSAYQRVIATLEGLLAQGQVPVRAPELVAKACAEHAALPTRVVEACLQTSQRFWIVPGDWVCLRSWGKGVKGRWVLAALQAIGRPAHFAEIGTHVRAMAPSVDSLTDPNVQAILARLPDVHRTEDGIFACKVWGLTEGAYIADLLEEALEQQGGPVSLDELVQYVRARKVCSQSSIFHILETDDRFLRLRPRLYFLAEGALDGAAGEQLRAVRAVPRHPEILLHVLDRMMARGRMSHAAIQSLLADLYQASRADNHVRYLLRRGWAAVEADGELVPTDRARHLYAIKDPAERLARFALSDANFQAYLIRLLIEDLIRRSHRSQGVARVGTILAGGLAPLRPIYEVMTGRLYGRYPQQASPEEREMHLLQVIRAPGVQQVFTRWVRPVTGYIPMHTRAVREWLTARMGSFPAWPSRLQLGQVPREATRLLCLSVALAAEADAAVDYGRLAAFAGRQGLQCPDLATLAAELLAAGVFVDDRDPAQVRLLTPHEVHFGRADLPGGLPGGLDAFRASLWAAGVLVSRRDVREASPVVRIYFTAPA